MKLYPPQVSRQKMAQTDYTTINACQPLAKTASTNLLDFVNTASSSIQEALAPKKKRNVNVRKFLQKRVKRLNDKGPKPSGQTKNKSVLRTTKPDAAHLLQNVGSRSWPLLNTTNEFSIQTQGLTTSSYPTSCSPPTYSYASSETSLYQTPSNNKVIDAELDSLLSELAGIESQPSTRHNSDSFQAGVSPSYTPQSTLESQVYLAEHPFSPPNSDCSDDLFDDSAYSSPIGSVGYRSTACSPPMPASEWPVQSPPDAPVTTQYPVPVTSTVWFPEQPAVSGSGWLPQYNSFDQGPPMTPTVSELLLDRAPNYF